MWFRSSDLNAADGASITAWPDASGNGNHTSQGTPGLQPLLRNTGFNGHPALEFDNVDDFLTGVPLNLPTGDAAYTVIVAARRSGAVAAFPNLISIGTNANEQAFSLFLNTDGSYSSGAKGGTRVIGTNPNTLNQSWIVSGQYSGNAGEHRVYINGILNNSLNESTPLPMWTQTAFRIGDDVAGGQNFGGLIAEILVFDSALSEANRSGVECYLGRRYSLILNPPCLSP